jgi:hypothetical protein
VRFEEVSTWPASGDLFQTQGHLVEPDHALVRVSPEARDSYLSLVADSVIPDGTVVAEFHHNAEGKSAGPVYVMQKTGSAWSYLVLDSTGGISEKAPQGCEGCHAAGVADRLFGPPRPNLRPSP